MAWKDSVRLIECSRLKGKVRRLALKGRILKARIIHQINIGNQRLCRIQLASGEKVFIKLILAPGFFLGIWELGSMNPFAIALDRLQSLRTGIRTAGYIPLWALGDEQSLSDRDDWRFAIKGLFSDEGDDRLLLDTVAEVIMRSSSVDVLRTAIANIEAAAKGK
jgi:hypothetical protein